MYINIYILLVDSSPPTYCRCKDDIFIEIYNFKQIENLKSYFKEHPRLSFSYEIESYKELPCLDTIIRRNKEQQQYYRIPNVTILATEHNKQDLAKLKALPIIQNGLKIYKQTEDFIKLFKF